MKLRKDLSFVLAILMVVGIALGCKKDDDEPPPPPPNVLVGARIEATPTSPQTNEVSLLYWLVDDDLDLANIEIRYSTNGGLTYEPALATEFSGPGSSGTTGLATAPFPGMLHVFVWDTLTDLGPAVGNLFRLQVTPFDSEIGVPAATLDFTVDNTIKPPPSVVISPVATPQIGDVQIIYTLFDNQFTPAAITVEYSITGGPPFFQATEAVGAPSEGTTGLTTAPPPAGALHTYMWDSMADGIGLNPTPDTALVRITPADLGQNGPPDISTLFDVNNFSNTPPSVTIDWVTANLRPTGNVPVGYTLTDVDSDRINITAEFSTNGGATYAPAARGSGGQGTRGLPSSPGGTSYIFVWNSLANVGATDQTQCRIRITPSDGTVGVSDESAIFLVENGDFTSPWVTFISDASSNTLGQRMVVEFIEPIDPATVILGTSGAATFGVIEDNDVVAGGNPCPLGPEFTEVPGQIVFQAQNTRVIFFPTLSFKPNQEVRLALTSGITDVGGNPLFQDPVSPPVPSDPPSMDCALLLPLQVFEDRWLPGTVPECDTFLAHPNTDLWLYDFDTFRTFDGDLQNRGLAGGDAPTNAAARGKVIAAVLTTLSSQYNRLITGAPDPGRSWRISFVCTAPPGATLGVDYSRMCVGLDLSGQGVLGTAWLDPSNNRKEDDCRTSGPALGVFSGGINGTGSTLSPALAGSDLQFVDGSYSLGQGSPTEDARFTLISDVIDDWGHAVGTVGSHETGHSVGLQHDDSNSLNIMRASASRSFLSNGSTRFGTMSTGVLNANLGIDP